MRRPPIGANRMPTRNSVGRTVRGVRIGCQALSRCCLKAVSGGEGRREREAVRQLGPPVAHLARLDQGALNPPRRPASSSDRPRPAGPGRAPGDCQAEATSSEPSSSAGQSVGRTQPGRACLGSPWRARTSLPPVPHPPPAAAPATPDDAGRRRQSASRRLVARRGPPRHVRACPAGLTNPLASPAERTRRGKGASTHWPAAASSPCRRRSPQCRRQRRPSSCSCA